MSEPLSETRLFIRPLPFDGKYFFCISATQRDSFKDLKLLPNIFTSYCQIFSLFYNHLIYFFQLDSEYEEAFVGPLVRLFLIQLKL